MRIALITDGISPYVMGGVQRHSFHLARTLAAQGVAVDLYHTDKGSGEDIHALQGMEAAAKTHITSIGLAWPTGDRFPGHYLRELKMYSFQALEKYRERPPVDFIYAKGLTGWAFLEAKSRGAALPPIGIKAHGYEMFQVAPNLRTMLEHRMLRPVFRRQALQADVVFSYGGKITDLIRDRLGVAPEKIVEIPSGVAKAWLTAAPSSPHQPRKLVYLGRYERRKGIEELHKALSQHPAWQGQARFVFIGPIPENRRLSLPHVEYLGPIREVETLKAQLHDADVLLCPSFSEGMPNVIMEAMSRGLAIIATDVGAVNQMVIDGHNGWLIPPGDQEALSAAIQAAIEAPAETLASLKHHARTLVEKAFTWDQVGKRTLQELEKRVK